MSENAQKRFFSGVSGSLENGNPDTPNRDPQNALAFSCILKIIIFDRGQVFSYFFKTSSSKD
jgi:hypothetical protein